MTSRTVEIHWPNGQVTSQPPGGDWLAEAASAGVSIFWDSPFGPVRFDFAEAFLYEDYDKREFFRFSTRTGF